MRAIGNLLALSLCSSSAAAAGVGPIPSCSSELAPLSIVAPRLPHRLHNEFVGKAQVSFVIGRTGRVESPSIVSTDWQPVGRSAGQPIGYSEAILAAVAQWRYPPRKSACGHEIPVEFLIDEAPNSGAGRPNNSFKPTPLRGAA